MWAVINYREVGGVTLIKGDVFTSNVRKGVESENKWRWVRILEEGSIVKPKESLSWVEGDSEKGTIWFLIEENNRDWARSLSKREIQIEIKGKWDD